MMNMSGGFTSGQLDKLSSMEVKHMLRKGQEKHIEKMNKILNKRMKEEKMSVHDLESIMPCQKNI